MPLEFLAAQQDFNDQVRAYKDAMVRHRQAILDLNTAVGERVLAMKSSRLSSVR